MKQAERRNKSTEKLIRAYLELASERGVASITFDSIGERAGYSRGLAFQKFGSKDGLLEAVINYLHGEVERAREVSHAEGNCGLEALIQFCRLHLLSDEGSHEMRAYFILMSSAVAEQSDMARHFNESHKRSKAMIMSIIGAGIEDGSIREDVDAEKLALLVGTQLMGITTQAIIDPNLEAPAMFEALKRQILQAYGTPEGIRRVEASIAVPVSS